jgi:streptomycin 6-kinase
MTPTERLLAWGASPTGEVWRTPSSDLAAGVLDGAPVVVKAARIEEEQRGNRLMAWWGRHGGLPVLAHEGDAVLLARATGPRDLLAWSSAGRDDEAEEVLADVVVRLHAMPEPPEAVGLVPLRRWFRDLVDATQVDPLLDRAASVARDLLGEPGPAVALHGDVHHGNVLDLGDRWVAIDPKALVGHPAFDVANALCNPTERTAVARLEPRLDRFADRLGLDRSLLAAWTAAWCGLSLVWSAGSGPGDGRACRSVLQLLVR